MRSFERRDSRGEQARRVASTDRVGDFARDRDAGSTPATTRRGVVDAMPRRRPRRGRAKVSARAANPRREARRARRDATPRTIDPSIATREAGRARAPGSEELHERGLPGVEDLLVEGLRREVHGGGVRAEDAEREREGDVSDDASHDRWCRLRRERDEEARGVRCRGRKSRGAVEAARKRRLRPRATSYRARAPRGRTSAASGEMISRATRDARPGTHRARASRERE